MRQQAELQQIIDEFFKALDAQRDFSQAEQAIIKLRLHFAEQPEYTLWALYFSGILAEERDRNWAQAEQNYRQVLATDPAPVLRAYVLLALGITYDRQARWQESIQLCEESATLWQQTGHPMRQVVVLRQIAYSYAHGCSAGEFDTRLLKIAQARCQQALDILAVQQATPQLDTPITAELLLYNAALWQTMGEIQLLAGDYPAAIDCFQHYLAISTTRNDPGRIAYARWNLADAYQLAGTEFWAEALTLYMSALSVFQQRKEFYYSFSILASQGALHQKLGEFQQAFACYEASLALVEKVRHGISSEAARSGFFATVVNIYANAILAQLAAGNLSTAFGLMESSRSRAFLDRLTNDSATVTAQVDGEPLALAELQALLSPEAVLFEYYTTGLLKTQGGYRSEQQTANSVLSPPAKTLLFVVTKTTIEVHDLGFSPNTLIPSEIEKPVEDYFLFPNVRRTLYDKLIAPCEHLLQGKRRLYIIPHGPLHYIPFHALLTPDGETLLHTGGPEIVYAPSAAILLRSRPAAKAPSSSPCLAVGYNGDADNSLRFAEAEAEFIAHLAGGQALVGASPKKAALYQQASACSLLHFSCHGEFDPESPLESTLHIAPGETLTGREIMEHLHLHCDLVTLSACESGLSLVQRGDELYGLLRAFMYAGAPALIATLWRVDERSTLIFAEKFYELLLTGVSHAAALKTAQLFLKNLSRREALAILSRQMAHRAADPTTGEPIAVKAGHDLRQAQQYLKGLPRPDAFQTHEAEEAGRLPTTVTTGQPPRRRRKFLLILSTGRPLS